MIKKKHFKKELILTGNYRGSSHRDCNSSLKLDHKIPIVFHNLKKL